MQRLTRLAGYAALLVTPAALLVRALLARTGVSAAALGVGGSIVLVGGVAAAVEYDDVFGGLEGPSVGRADAGVPIAVIAAAGATYALSVHAGLGPVVAASVVGVAAGLGVPEFDTAAYCGAFVGMASPAVFPSVGYVFLAGAVAGLAFVATRGTFAGVGGKLGTLALFGCATTGLLTSAEFTTGPPLQSSSALLVIPVAVGGAVVTVLVSGRGGLGTVLGSALVGLVAGLSLPVLLPSVGGLLATVAFCSSFVGMSTTERLGSDLRVGLAGALCGLVFVAVAPVFVGAGGKLGTIAFVSCVALFGAGELQNTLASRTA